MTKRRLSILSAFALILILFGVTVGRGSTISAAGDVGAMLDGDYAYIAEANLVEDTKTESGYAIRTGTAPWDNESEQGTPGNDTTDLDNCVRSYDMLAFTTSYRTKTRTDAPYRFYKEGRVFYEYVVEGTDQQITFDVGSMGWLEAKKDSHYTLSSIEQDGKTYQVLSGDFIMEPSSENPSAIGESYQELNVVMRVMGMYEGQTVTPTFTYWLEYNDIPDTGIKSLNLGACSTHGDIEPKSVTSPDINVTSTPRFNIVVSGYNDPRTMIRKKWDFNKGNTTAPNYGLGALDGRSMPVSIGLEMRGKTTAHGLRGCELPDGGDITVNFALSSTYRNDVAEVYDTTGTGYAPLLWAATESDTGAYVATGGRENIATTSVWGQPLNGTSNYKKDINRCYHGGNWDMSENPDGTYTFTIHDYAIDMNSFPYTASGSSAKSYTYYNPETLTGCWELSRAYIGVGAVWLIQPFEATGTGVLITDVYGSGTFTDTLTAGGLCLTGMSGAKLEAVGMENTNQMVTSDDIRRDSIPLRRDGSFDTADLYSPYDKWGWDVSLTPGCYDNGKDYIYQGGKLSITTYYGQNGQEGDYQCAAVLALYKFDDQFFVPESVQIRSNTERSTPNVSIKLLWGCKPNRTGWYHPTADPDDSSWETEMREATLDDLIYFSDLDTATSQGYIPVAVLVERVGMAREIQAYAYMSIIGHVADTAQTGKVYMIQPNHVVWRKGSIKEEVADFYGKSISDLTDDDFTDYLANEFPTRADVRHTMSVVDDYPKLSAQKNKSSTDGVKNYKKAFYDENGYAGGDGSRYLGDSCLLLGFASYITKNTIQLTSSGVAKNAYDLDSGQRIVDYALYPAIRRENIIEAAGDTVVDVYIEDTLPVNLTYIPGSSYYGGTYIQTAEGQQGTISGGRVIEPEITENVDGTTTLKYTLYNVRVSNELETSIEPVYYSCVIGDLEDVTRDVNNNDQLTNEVVIWSSGETRHAATVDIGNKAIKSILVAKNNAISLSKTTDTTCVDLGDDFTFRLNVGNNSTNVMNALIIDGLPYNGDSAGSEFHGDLVVKSMTITSLLNTFGTDLRLYGTTDTSKRGRVSIDFTASGIQSDTNWVELNVDSTTGVVNLPANYKPTALAVVGVIDSNKTLNIKLTCSLPGGKLGDKIINTLSQGKLSSTAEVRITKRKISGRVWYDTAGSNTQTGADTFVNGIHVNLVKLVDGGNPENRDDYEQVDGMTTTTDDNGEYLFDNLPKGTYGVSFTGMTGFTLSDVDSAEDDTLDSDSIKISDDEFFIKGIILPQNFDGTVFTSDNNDTGVRAFTRLFAQKTWDDNDNQDGTRPQTINIAIKKNGALTGDYLTLSAADNWENMTEELNLYENGHWNNYSLIENVKPEGYELSRKTSTGTVFTFENKHEPERVKLVVRKVWDDADNQDAKRPSSVTVNLLKNGISVETIALNDDNNWTWSTEEDAYESGSSINWSFTEDSVEGYAASSSIEPVEVDGLKTVTYQFTNSYSPEIVNIPVQKIWVDADNQDGKRPEELRIALLANDVQVDSLILSEENNWAGSFNNKPRKSNGVDIVYTLSEEQVDGYTSEYDEPGHVFINTHEPELIDIPVQKEWDDADNQDGIRPDSVNVYLLANGVKVAMVTVKAGDDWKGIFENMPKYKDGKLIEYSFEEEDITGYEATYDMDGGVITNKHKPEVAVFSIEKLWNDNDNVNGLRPDKIDVKLLADGEEIETLTLSKANDWKILVDMLPKYRDNGTWIEYTVCESDVPVGYTSEVNGFVIINTLHIEKDLGKGAVFGATLPTGIFIGKGIFVLGVLLFGCYLILNYIRRG